MAVADIANYITSSPTTSLPRSTMAASMPMLPTKIASALRFTGFPSQRPTFNGATRAYNLFHHSQINDAFSAIWNHTFSPTFLNEFRVNAAGWRWNEVASNPQSPVGLPSDSIDQDRQHHGRIILDLMSVAF